LPNTPGQAPIGDHVDVERVDVDIVRLVYDLRTSIARLETIVTVSVPGPGLERSRGPRRRGTP
jgi:hypothetical protein